MPKLPAPKEEDLSKGILESIDMDSYRMGDKSKARIEHDAALLRVMVSLLKDDTELFKQYSDNEGFKRWLADTVFGLTYQDTAA